MDTELIKILEKLISFALTIINLTIINFQKKL